MPLYLCLIRPKVSFLLPGSLKRIGLGMLLVIMSLATTLVMDVLVHAEKTENANCLLSGMTHLKAVGNTIHWNSIHDGNSTLSKPVLLSFSLCCHQLAYRYWCTGVYLLPKPLLHEGFASGLLLLHQKLVSSCGNFFYSPFWKVLECESNGSQLWEWILLHEYYVSSNRLCFICVCC